MVLLCDCVIVLLVVGVLLVVIVLLVVGVLLVVVICGDLW